MTRIAPLLLTVGLLAGCYNEDKFTDDYTTAFCDKMASCEDDIVTGYTDLGMDEATAQSTYDTAYSAACESDASGDSGSSDDTCDFDADAGKTCVADIKDMSCDFFTTGSGYPDSCSTVCGE